MSTSYDLSLGLRINKKERLCAISKKQYGQHCVRSVWEDWCPAVLGSVGGGGGGKTCTASIIGRRVKLCKTHTHNRPDKRALSES